MRRLTGEHSYDPRVHGCLQLPVELLALAGRAGRRLGVPDRRARLPGAEARRHPRPQGHPPLPTRSPTSPTARACSRVTPTRRCTVTDIDDATSPAATLRRAGSLMRERAEKALCDGMSATPWR